MNVNMTGSALRSILSGVRRAGITCIDWLSSECFTAAASDADGASQRKRERDYSSKAWRVSKKQRRRFREKRFAKHLARFVDLHRFPDFQLTDDMIAAEAKRQTHGPCKLTESEVALLEPLRDGQKWKEVIIDGLVQEMAEWWSKGWGWWYPMAAHLRYERNDWIMKKALLEIRGRCEQNFVGFLIARGGSERAIAAVAGAPPKPLTVAVGTQPRRDERRI